MLFKMVGINKSFFGNKVLDNVTLELRAGEVHALIGENGAGKSTLMNIAAGLIRAESGDIYLRDRKVQIKSVLHASRLGISVVYQTPHLIPWLTVAENIFLGIEPVFFKYFINTPMMKKKAVEMLRSLGCSLHPDQYVHHTTLHDQYLVAISKAFCHRSKVLILDEPTSSLSQDEKKNLFKLIREYKESGGGIIYITHNLDEIPQICDRVTILRDGVKIDTLDVAETDEKELAKLMCGREVSMNFPPIVHDKGKSLLRMEHVTWNPFFRNVSLEVCEGEIVGIAGLEGSGRSEMAKVIFGQHQKDSGEIYWKGKKVSLNSPIRAVEKRFGYINDRLKAGLFMDMSVQNNMTISSLDKFKQWNFLKVSDELNHSLDNIIDLNIKVGHVDQKVKYLSGGNQQKVMLSKWLIADSEFYIMDEPTRGIDIASRSDIYLKIHELAREGKGILVISSDVQELLGLCNRIVVMYQGEVVANLLNDNLTETDLVPYLNGEKSTQDKTVSLPT